MTSEVAGKAGSVRVASLKMAGLKAMQRHERREDALGQARRVRDVDPLVYDASGEGLELVASYERHVAGARRNKGADAVALHAFVQFPTDLIEIDAENERRILKAAVDFINKTHGGDAVFHARLDRDEAGRHGVDVFFAPTYEKKSKSKPEGEKWVSLTKFGKSLALSKYGQNSPVFQGRALQDAFFEFLSNDLEIEGVKRGSKKITKDKDRVDPEVYKLNKDKEKFEEEKKELEKEKEKFLEERETFKKYVSQYHSALNIEKNKLQRKHLDFDLYKNDSVREINRTKELNKKNNVVGFALEKYFEGKIYVTPAENIQKNGGFRYVFTFDPEIMKEEQRNMMNMFKPFLNSVRNALAFFEDMFREMRLTQEQESKLKSQYHSQVRSNLRNNGIEI